nr:hypothetical protein [Neorhizobium tomejilense]
MTTALEIARKYGYMVETWETFSAEKKLPEGLLERALQVRKDIEATGESVTHVLYDLDDDSEGFLILGDNPELMSWELESHGFKEFDDIEVPVELSAYRQTPGATPSM